MKSRPCVLLNYLSFNHVVIILVRAGKATPASGSLGGQINVNLSPFGLYYQTLNSILCIGTAARMLTFRKDKLLASVPAERRAEAEALIEEIQAGLGPLRESAEAKDKASIYPQKAELLTLVGALERTMLGDFPFDVPEEYSDLPQLKGRATVEFTTSKGSVTAILDGYSAPVTAGNFADLVQRGFYNGLEFTRAEDYYVLQIGDPPGPEDGFIDPATGEYRAIPLEILVKGDEEPIYEFTLESIGRFKDEPVLPFSAFGTLGMARPGEDPNGASSQFFFFLFEPELTPAGLNLIDGRYAGFGYVVEGKEVLEKLELGDKIESAKLVQGAENLVQPFEA